MSKTIVAKRSSSAHSRIGSRATSWSNLLTILPLLLLVGYTGICSAKVPQPRKALLFQALRQAQIDPNVLVEEDNVLGEALNEKFLHNPKAPIDLLSICRLQCQLEDPSTATNSTISNEDLQLKCTVEMFDLTQASEIAPPNITLAFGSDPYAKNRDFVEWCHRLLTSSHFEDPEKLEEFRREMVLSNPYWKSAVKATYLTMTTEQKDTTSDEDEDDTSAGELLFSFDDILQDPKEWLAAIQRLREHVVS
jgi:hypothetical protein